MNRELVGEPGVSAFLKSVLRYMADIRGMERTYTTYLHYDPNPHLEKLKKKLISLQDVLVDGEARRLDELSVDEWMDDLKHLFYDLEDILDDIKQTLVQPDGIDQVRFDDTHLYGSSIVIKDRLAEILGRTDELVDRSKDLDLRRGVGYVTWGKSQATRSTVETSPEVEISEIHGREDDKKYIVEKLLVANDKAKKNYDVVSIVGMGGLGKTTLAKLIFDDSDVTKHFDLKSWVCISDVFDVTRATKELIENLGGGGGDQQSLAGLQKRLKETLGNKRFLFVLDDVWSSSEWETMKAPFSSCASGSKILVTTRNTKIVNALGNKEPYQLLGLDHEQCMAIFRDKAFVDAQKEPEKLVFGEKIVKACGGLPLAVKIIGSMLEGAEEEKWRAVSENTIWDMDYIKDGIHPAIRLSYHYLPASLKRCFEYLAIIPSDYAFQQNYVVRLWIAEGLVQDMDGRMAEDIGNEYYNDLKARSLIQEDDRMHDIVKHLASLLSRKFCYKENVKEAVEGMRHVFLRTLNAMNCEFLTHVPCLRTLIIRNVRDEDEYDNFVLLSTIKSCKMLRTLQIYKIRAPLEKSFIDQLTHIRCLSIGSSAIKHLSDSLCMLDNLQFLILANNGLENLPDKINHLVNLRCLKFRISSISTLPESICALSQLQVLNFSECAHLEVLPKDIGNLRRLRNLNLSRTSISSLPQPISALSQLQVIKLASCAHLEVLPPDIGHLRRLRKLDLSRTSISSLPESICALGQLQFLNLYHCASLKLLPEDIGNLRSMRTLYLSKTSISSLPESICALCQLQVLQLNDCDILKELPRDIGNLRSLRTLEIKRSSILSVPESILNVTGLQHLLVDEHQQLPLHIGRLARLEELPIYHVGKKEGQGLGELHLMNRLKGEFGIASMENIGGVEEAIKADLKTKKNVTKLEFRWSQPGCDEGKEVKIMEALKPHDALRKLMFFNYGGDKFPDWIMSSSIRLNLRYLDMEGLNKICEMVNMEFVSLNTLKIENCPILRTVSLATPNLRWLYMINCGELEAASVEFLPSLSNKSGMHTIVSQFVSLDCTYNIFEYFFELLKSTNSKWDSLTSISLSARGRSVASLPGGWPSMMVRLYLMYIKDIAAGKFQFVADGDESAFPPSLLGLSINNCFCRMEDSLPHYSHTINSDGKLEMEESTNGN